MLNYYIPKTLPSIPYRDILADIDLYSDYMVGCPIISYKYINTGPLGLQVYTSPVDCKTSPNSSEICRTMKIPSSVVTTTPYTADEKILFTGNKEIINKKVIHVQCSATGVVITPPAVLSSDSLVYGEYNGIKVITINDFTTDDVNCQINSYGLTSTSNANIT